MQASFLTAPFPPQPQEALCFSQADGISLEQARFSRSNKWPFRPAGGSIHYGHSGIQAVGSSILTCFHYWKGREGGHAFLSGNDMGVISAQMSLAK